jgi:exosortase A-associated hydrolase 1
MPETGSDGFPPLTRNEDALNFDCEGESLVGILSGTGRPNARGVLIVVGGPQYRVGSHRQFVLLARSLAERGVPALRFDYRGMGDSGGEARTFERVGLDIRRAIDRFFAAVPGMKEVVVWGLCDAASAALIYAHEDERVCGLVLLNPWVRTAQGLARAHLKHYYLRRLLQAGLWQKVARGEFDFRGAAAAFGRMIVDATRGRRGSAGPAEREAPFTERMEDGLRRFRGKVLLILSGNDLTAQEFKDFVAGSARWRRLLESDRVTRRDLPEANHTFGRRDWREQVERWTGAWVENL